VSYDLTLILCSVIIVFAFSIQTIIGFGAGLIAIPLLSYFYEPQHAVLIILFLQCLNGVTVYKLRRGFSLLNLSSEITSIIIGVIIGSIIFLYINVSILYYILGFYLIITAVYGTNNLIIPSKSKYLVKIYFLSCGILHALIGTGGGPALVAYVYAKHSNIVEAKATILLYLLILNLVRSTIILINGKFVDVFLFDGLIFIPSLLLGIYLGFLISSHIRISHLNILIRLLFLVSGINLLLKN
jgi:uncharacterized protein